MRIPFANRFRRLAANASGLVSTRLALFGLELQEELARQIGRLIVLLAVFMFGALSLLFAGVFILVLAWQYGHLLAAAASLAFVCMMIALGGIIWLRRSAGVAPQAFSQTLAEFSRDEATLRGEVTESAAEKKNLS